MMQRTRAWRRRKARLTGVKIADTRHYFQQVFHDDRAKPIAALKPHQPGKLTHVQEMRLLLNVGDQLREGLDAYPA